MTQNSMSSKKRTAMATGTKVETMSIQCHEFDRVSRDAR